MTPTPQLRRAWVLLAVGIPLLALFVYVGLRSGPLAPVTVTLVKAEARALHPALFGIGTVEARYTHRIGPTVAGRVERLDVQVGDAVHAGQVLGEMDPIDLDERIRSQDAALRRALAGAREAEARESFARSQSDRYERLFVQHSISEEAVLTRRQELEVAAAAAAAARADAVRARADLGALRAQRGNLRLVAPVAGVVSVRDADPGTTVVAGQAVVEIIDPATQWINVRFDQFTATGLAAGLPAHIVLRSRGGAQLAGRVLRVEPRADSVTEEILAKVVFDTPPRPAPPAGELAEVTVDLPALPVAVVVPNAAIHRADDGVGAWRVVDGRPRLVPLRLGAADLDGNVQVQDGLQVGDEVVLYSARALSAGSRIRVAARIVAAAR
ncbi:MAG: efflux RND transporter periplasmic adaptor subunit [Steroidobacteraceae bacterium]